MPFEPIPGSRPLTVSAAVTPPLVYFLALTLLPPFNHVSTSTKRIIAIVRATLAILATVFFARLPLRYHVPWSCGLTYILNLVGWYGCTRIIDVFFITGRTHIPRRVKRKLKMLEDPDSEVESESSPVLKGGAGKKQPAVRQEELNPKLSTKRSSFLVKVAKERKLCITDIKDVIYDNNPLARKRHGSFNVEKAKTDNHEQMKPDWAARFLYALDLELSMRGVGWSWTTADVRHSRKTWLPTLEDEFHQLFFSDIPLVAGSLALERYIYTCSDRSIGIDSLNYAQRALLTLSQGVFLFGTFSAGYTAGAIATAPLRSRYRQWTTHNLAFWPPLNSEPLIAVTTVRQFWSKSWHRLFSRLFLVWGVWPGQWLEKKLCRSSFLDRLDPERDIGKVLGAFFVSGIVHSAAGISINGGRPSKTFEWLFFFTSGIAVVIEQAVQRLVQSWRGDKNPRWYDPWIGRVWTVSVLLWSGQYFTRGWYDSGLIEEMVTLPFRTLGLGLDVVIHGLSDLRAIVKGYEAA